MSKVIFNRFKLWKLPTRKNVLATSTCHNYVTNYPSPIALTFNSKPKALNFNFSLSENVGLFHIPELCRPEGLHLLKENGIDEVQQLVEECCDVKRRRRIVEIFDELSNALCKVADLAEFIRIAHPDHHYCRLAENTCISIATLVEQLNTNTEIYKELRKVVQEGDSFPTTSLDQHVAQLFLSDFEQSGIHLPEEKRRLAVDLNEYALQLGQRFSIGAHQPQQVNKEDLPSHIRHQFALEGDNITINGLYTDATNEIAREAAYKIYLFPSEEQETTLVKLVQARNKLAQLCGFPSYAHR